MGIVVRMVLFVLECIGHSKRLVSVPVLVASLFLITSKVKENLNRIRYTYKLGSYMVILLFGYSKEDWESGVTWLPR